MSGFIVAVLVAIALQLFQSAEWPMGREGDVRAILWAGDVTTSAKQTRS
jgi:hypothetical protein